MAYVDPITGVEEDDIEWGVGDDSESFDELLGFDFASQETTNRTGLWALINSSLVSHPALPALELIFDRVPSLFTTSLRHLANDTLDVSLDTVASIRFRDFLENRTGASVLGIFKSDCLDNFSLMSADATFVFSIVDFLLGGKRAHNVGSETRIFTSIETALAKRIFEVLCQELSTAFSGIVDEPFILEKVETRARFAAITRETAVCALAKFRIEIGDATGKLEVLIPYANLEPVREKLQHDYQHHCGTEKNRWASALQGRVNTTNIELWCVLDEKSMTLGEIAALGVGDVVTLDTTLDQQVRLRAGNHDLVRGKIGRAGEHLAVCLANHINADECQPAVIEAMQ